MEAEITTFRSRSVGALLTLPNILLAGFSLFALFYLLFSPSLATPAFPQDTFFILSDGWRFANGQVPYRDYHSALGPLSGLLTGLGMLLCRPGSGLAHGALIGQGLFLLLLLPAALFVAYRRLRDPINALFCFLIVSLVASRAVLGDPASSHLTITGTYNTQGYALLLVFALMTILPARNSSNRLRIADDVLGGLLLMLLFFEKVSYFGAGAAVLVAASVIRLLPAGRMLGLSPMAFVRICAVGIVSAAVILIVFHIPPLRLVQDLTQLVQAQGAKMDDSSRLGRAPKIMWDALRQYALVLFGFPVLLCFVHGRLPRSQDVVLLLLALFLFALSIGIMMGNSLQSGDQFLLLLLLFLLVEIFARSSAASAAGAAVVSVFLVLVVLQHQAVAVVSTMRAASIEFRSGAGANRWLAKTGLADLAIPQSEVLDIFSPPRAADWGNTLSIVREMDTVFYGDLSMYEISQLAAEGRCLLDQNAGPRDRIYTDGPYYNIFALLRQQAPPKGGSLGFISPAPGSDFELTGKADQIRDALSDATLIMSARNELIPNSLVEMPESRDVMKDFASVGQSRFWILWRRKGTSGPESAGACATP